MDALEQYIKKEGLTQENILRYLDEYEIYCHYIGEELELNTKYSSPLRPDANPDDDPSFALYYGKQHNDMLMFKDHGNGLTGGVFRFVQLYLGISLKQVLLQINSDFELGFSNAKLNGFKPKPLISSKPLKKAPTEIRITTKDFHTQKYNDYWESLGITKPILDLFNTTEVRLIHFKSGTKTATVFPKTLCIGY